jgi:hypothetical protein
MQNSIIISIIIAIIIFFLYKKNNKFEHFDNPTISLESIKNLVSTFVNPRSISFNNVIVNNIDAEELNNNIVVDIDLSSNIAHGNILKYDATKKVWYNSTPVFPQYLSMNIYGTMGTIGNTDQNLLDSASINKCQDFGCMVSSILGGWTTLMPTVGPLKLDPTVDISSNKYYSYYGPYDPVTQKYGLRFDMRNKRIFGFDPSKTYKFDCSLFLYYLKHENGSSKIKFKMNTYGTNRQIADVYMSAYRNGMSQSLTLKTIQSGIPYEGIYFALTSSTGVGSIFGSNDTYFWKYDEYVGSRNMSLTIFIQEITKVL